MSFPAQLRPLVDRAGGPTKAAAVLHVTRQALHRWLRGEEPNAVTQAGALDILRRYVADNRPASSLVLPPRPDPRP